MLIRPFRIYVNLLYIYIYVRKLNKKIMNWPNISNQLLIWLRTQSCITLWDLYRLLEWLLLLLFLWFVWEFDFSEFSSNLTLEKFPFLSSSKLEFFSLLLSFFFFSWDKLLELFLLWLRLRLRLRLPVRLRLLRVLFLEPRPLLLLRLRLRLRLRPCLVSDFLFSLIKKIIILLIRGNDILEKI